MSGEATIENKPRAKKKKMKRPKTRIEKLELKQAKLRSDLKKVLKEISKDTEEHRRGGNSQTLSDRQKLANRSIIIRSQLLRLQDEIEVRNYVTEDTTSKRIQTKIKNRYTNAAKKHHRLLHMTIELEKLKEDEHDVRFIANDELGIEDRQDSEPVEDDFLTERRKIDAGITRIESTSFRHSTKELDEDAAERHERLESVRDSLSKLGVETPREKFDKADGLAQKYELMREMRNLAHGQMISRHQKNSYWQIIPPYRRKRKKVEHVRRAYVRNFYEDKVNMDKAKKLHEENEEVRKREAKKKEMMRYKMSSGRTIALKKMAEFAPPGMDLVGEITPVDC